MSRGVSKKVVASNYLSILFENICYYSDAGFSPALSYAEDFFKGALHMASVSGFISEGECRFLLSAVDYVIRG